MAARDNFNGSVASAEATKATSLQAAQASYVASLTAATCDIGYTLQSGNYAALAAATASANASKAASRLAAEQAKQSSIQVARDTLRGTGDVAPA